MRSNNFLSLRTIIIFLGLVLFVPSGTSEVADEENHHIYVFPEPKPITKEDSIREAEAEKKFTEEMIREAQHDLPYALEYLEKNYNSEIRGLPFGVYTLDMRLLPLLTKVVLYNPRPYNRGLAISTIALIEEYNEDTSAIPLIRNALRDSAEDVRLAAACALTYLGIEDPIAISTLYEIATGKNEEGWIVDYEGHVGLSHLTRDTVIVIEEKYENSLRRRRPHVVKIQIPDEEKINKEKQEFRNVMRNRAILTLGYLSVVKGNIECTELLEKLWEEKEIEKNFGTRWNE